MHIVNIFTDFIHVEILYIHLFIYLGLFINTYINLKAVA